jgi:hypothetical protein
MIPLLDQLEIYIVEDLEHEEFSEAGLSENNHSTASPSISQAVGRLAAVKRKDLFVDSTNGRIGGETEGRVRQKDPKAERAGDRNGRNPRDRRKKHEPACQAIEGEPSRRMASN